MPITEKNFKKAAIAGAVWYFTYLYIRRYLNPKNEYSLEPFYQDAMYGALASFVSSLVRDYLNEKLLK